MYDQALVFSVLVKWHQLRFGLVPFIEVLELLVHIPVLLLFYVTIYLITGYNMPYQIRW